MASLAPTALAPRRPVSAATQRSSAVATTAARPRPSATRQGWEPPSSAGRALPTAAEPAIIVPPPPLEKSASAASSSSMFALLPKRQSSMQHKTYSVAAKSATEQRRTGSEQRTPPPQQVMTMFEEPAHSVATTASTNEGIHLDAAGVAPQPTNDMTPTLVTPIATPREAGARQDPPTATSAPTSSVPSGAPPSHSQWLHQFPTVGHFACPCGLPICTAASKTRSLGGHPTFSRYFGPSLSLKLTLPSCGMFGAIATFTATCVSCHTEIGYIPLTTTVLSTTGRGGAGEEGVHALRMTCSTLTYHGQKAPPEYMSLEVAALSNAEDTDGSDNRRASASGRGLRGLLAAQQTQSPSNKAPARKVGIDSSTSDNSDDSDDESEDDDDLWLSLRQHAKSKQK